MGHTTYLSWSFAICDTTLLSLLSIWDSAGASRGASVPPLLYSDLETNKSASHRSMVVLLSARRTRSAVRHLRCALWLPKGPLVSTADTDTCFLRRASMVDWKSIIRWLKRCEALYVLGFSSTIDSGKGDGDAEEEGAVLVLGLHSRHVDLRKELV